MGYPKKAASYNQIVPHLIEKLARFATLRTDDEIEIPCESNEQAKKMRFQIYGYLAVLDKGSPDDKKRADLARELMVAVKGNVLVFSQKNTITLATSLLSAMSKIDEVIATKSQELGLAHVQADGTISAPREIKPFVKELRATRPTPGEFYQNLLPSASDDIHNLLYMIVGTLPDPYAGYISKADYLKVLLAELGISEDEWNRLAGREEFLENLWTQLEVWSEKG